ncbi:ankyrin repeat-containing protein [Acanthamoeba castellanii str. Neff]|uniref:Ankyrin repeat-containing protein n=1 Tax=Acanthamoeba castellanii (strain ATCC 30010 / Neff) TaxID=1257118 RepID=L8GZU9_ACACF|nr:ankyrin repeat-containing protein [Acanthamoeba castellanii str. Neff]ELR18038.1 ankyrin repeat-containing protein [Acanthamoeba castellanii str. Neff]
MDILLAGDAGDIGLVRELMKAPRADVNKAFSHAKFNKRSTALHYASRSGHLALVKVLVDEFGANIDAREKEDWTPVYYAANNGFVPCPPGN